MEFTTSPSSQQVFILCLQATCKTQATPFHIDFVILFRTSIVPSSFPLLARTMGEAILCRRSRHFRADTVVSSSLPLLGTQRSLAATATISARDVAHVV